MSLSLGQQPRPEIQSCPQSWPVKFGILLIWLPGPFPALRPQILQVHTLGSEEGRTSKSP